MGEADGVGKADVVVPLLLFVDSVKPLMAFFMNARNRRP